MKLKSISCDPMCGFMVRSHSENEVIDMANMHVKKVHPDMKVTREELKGKMASE